jgi:hypothetical protein
LDYSSTLKMEGTCSSETPVDFQRTTRRYMPQDKIILLSRLGVTVLMEPETTLGGKQEQSVSVMRTGRLRMGVESTCEMAAP